MTYNPGTGLSKNWYDHFFVTEYTSSPARARIHAFTLEFDGVSLELKTTDETILSGILTTGINFGPDGALYLADRIDGWDSKDKGQIWKLHSSDTNSAGLQVNTKTLPAEGV